MSQIESLDSPDVTTPSNRYPVWSPRFWHGMRTVNWWSLLANNRFSVSARRLHLVVGVSLFTPANDLLALLQSLIYGRRIRNTKIERAPIFILGHWRSGTTFLHELLVLDDRFAYPSTYQCFAPSHFLVSEWIMLRLGGFLLPKKRPMDDMAAGWELPQEDEFALMNLGVPTPYLRIAFPQTQAKALNYLSMQGLTEEQRICWRTRFTWFLQALTLRYLGKQLVLKSPPHTGRLAELVELFPESKFIHLTRDPRTLFSSTMRLWKSLDQIQALQEQADEESMQDYVWKCMSSMYDGFERARIHVNKSQIVDLRYEDLIADPVEAMRRLYARLDLGEFSQVEAAICRRLQGHSTYRVNTHCVTPEIEQKTMKQWKGYAQKYGYCPVAEEVEPIPGRIG